MDIYCILYTVPGHGNGDAIITNLVYHRYSVASSTSSVVYYWTNDLLDYLKYAVYISLSTRYTTDSLVTTDPDIRATQQRKGCPFVICMMSFFYHVSAGIPLNMYNSVFSIKRC